MTYNQLLKKFVDESVDLIQNNLINMRTVSEDGSITRIHVLDFLRIERNLNEHGVLNYAVNLSNSMTADYQDQVVPKYEFLELGQRFGFNLKASKDFAHPSLDVCVENAFDCIFSPNFSFPDMMVKALFQYSYKKLQDEQSREEYLKLVNEHKMHELLFDQVKQHCQGRPLEDEETGQSIKRLLDSVASAIDLLYQEAYKLLDQYVVQLTCNCDKGFCFETYRYLLERIERHFKPNETEKIIHDQNVLLLKLITSTDLETDDLPISYPVVQKFRALPTNKVFNLLYSITEHHGFNHYPDTIALLMKLLVVHSEEIGVEENFPNMRLTTLKDTFNVLLQYPKAEHVLANFVWLLHLSNERRFQYGFNVSLNDFAQRINPLDKQGDSSDFDPHNLKLVGKWLTPDLLFNLYSEWVEDCNVGKAPFITTSKISLDKISEKSLNLYNVNDDGYKLNPILTANEFLAALQYFNQCKDPLYGYWTSNRHLLLKFRDQLRPECLLAVKVNRNPDDQSYKLEIEQVYGVSGHEPKAVVKALLHREVYNLNKCFDRFTSTCDV